VLRKYATNAPMMKLRNFDKFGFVLVDFIKIIKIEKSVKTAMIPTKAKRKSFIMLAETFLLFKNI
jgi:hypothetical protein